MGGLKLHLQFLNLIDELIANMFTANVAMLVDKLSNLMASDVDHFFDVSLIKKMKNNPYPFLFKIYLLPFVSWFDHAILIELVESSDVKEAIHLIKQFDSSIDYDQPITSCIPEFSHLIIPYKGDESEYTLLVTKHFNKGHNVVVIDLLNIKQELTLCLGITHYATRLVAMDSKLSYLYWIIPRKIHPVIKDRMKHDQQQLLDKGIIVVGILSYNNVSDDQDEHSKENFMILNFNTEDTLEVHMYTQIYVCSYICMHILRYVHVCVFTYIACTQLIYLFILFRYLLLDIRSSISVYVRICNFIYCTYNYVF